MFLPVAEAMNNARNEQGSLFIRCLFCGGHSARPYNLNGLIAWVPVSRWKMEVQKGKIAGSTVGRWWSWDHTPGLCEPQISSLSISASPPGAWGGRQGALVEQRTRPASCTVRWCSAVLRAGRRHEPFPSSVLKRQQWPRPQQHCFSMTTTTATLFLWVYT